MYDDDEDDIFFFDVLDFVVVPPERSSPPSFLLTIRKRSSIFNVSGNNALGPPTPRFPPPPPLEFVLVVLEGDFVDEDDLGAVGAVAVSPVVTRWVRASMAKSLTSDHVDDAARSERCDVTSRPHNANRNEFSNATSVNNTNENGNDCNALQSRVVVGLFFAHNFLYTI